MDIEHNSREKFYRFPFGAVTCGGEVRLRLAVSGAGIPSAVRLVYMEDGKGEVRKDMPYIFDVGDHCIYSVNEMPEKAGLVWYYFLNLKPKEVWFITATIQNNSAELVKCVSIHRVIHIR